MNGKEKSLEQRVQEIEDRLEIYQVVCGYGYAVDGCNRDAAAKLFAEDGVYDVGDVGRFAGRESVAAITSAPTHLELVNGGCGHLSTLPYIVIDRDRASATCHTMLVQKRDENGFAVGRLSASRSELSRGSDGRWQIDVRQNWPLDGRPEGPILMGRLMEEPSAKAEESHSND